MALGEVISTRVAYKAHSTGAMTANTLATPASDPGDSGGQILRKTSFSLNLDKDTYQSNEIRSDEQLADFRHGVKRVNGSLNGELSCGTYFDFMEAWTRGTKVAAISKSNTDFTSVAADSGTSKFTLGGGDPVSEGYKVGMVWRFTNLSEPLNNSKNFLITGFGGGSNREVSVYPAPTTMGADSAFNVTSVGKRVSVPSSSFTKRKFAFEAYHSDLDLYRLFYECRTGGINLGVPGTGLATIEIPVMGREMDTASGGSAPFFSSPAAETTTAVLASINGLVRAGGINQGVVSGVQINCARNLSGDGVVGQNFVPEVFSGRALVTGQLTFWLEDLTLINAYKNETDLELLLMLAASTADAADFLTVHLPRIKLGNAQVGIEGEQGIPVTAPFQALKYLGSSAGVEQTTIAFVDAQAP